MTFIEEVEAFKSPIQNGCKVRLFLDGQSSKDLEKKKLQPVTDEDIKLAFESNTIKAIHKALLGRGYTYSDKTVIPHLKGECACFRKKEAA